MAVYCSGVVVVERRFVNPLTVAQPKSEKRCKKSCVLRLLYRAARTVGRLLLLLYPLSPTVSGALYYSRSARLFCAFFRVPVEQLLKDLQLFFLPDTTTTPLQYTAILDHQMSFFLFPSTQCCFQLSLEYIKIVNFGVMT